MTSEKLILYAEDDENDAFFMRRAFELAGIQHRLCIVTDGKEAIEYLSGTGRYENREKNPFPCLMVLDLSMPGKSGLDVLKWARSEPASCSLPVVVLTSSNQEIDIHRAYLLGANAYLIKPGKPDELITMVNGITNYWLNQ